MADVSSPRPTHIEDIGRFRSWKNSKGSFGTCLHRNCDSAVGPQGISSPNPMLEELFERGSEILQP